MYLDTELGEKGMESVGRGSHNDDISPKRVLNTSPSNSTARTVIATEMSETIFLISIRESEHVKGKLLCRFVDRKNKTKIG